MRRLSIRARLVASTFAAVLVVSGGLLVAVATRTHQHLAAHVDRMLETESDEILSLLAEDDPPDALARLLRVETAHRLPPYVYFYQVADGHGRVLMKSANLDDAGLSVPLDLRPDGRGRSARTATTVVSGSSGQNAVVRQRSERVAAPPSWHGDDLVVQVAVSLAPIERTVRRSLVHSVAWAVVLLALMLFLLWFVTTRSLRPVARLTQQASRIGARKLRERLALSGSGDELDQLAVVLNDMLDRLQRSLHQVEQFTSDAAHQLRTPLTRIRGELDLVLRDGVGEPVHGQIERVQDEVERLTRMCGRLLLLARLDHEARDDTLFDEHLDLDDVVDELLEEIAPLAREKGLVLTRGPVAHAAVRGSRPLVVEALLNLLDNAMRFTDEGGAIEVSVTRAGRVATVAVADSGPGIPPEERDRVFRRFCKIPRAGRDAGEGTGLGLAIVKAIAEAHGGGVELASRPGTGSCFRIRLPSAETR